MGCGVSNTVGTEATGAQKPEPVAAQARLPGSSVTPQKPTSQTDRRNCSGKLLLRPRSLLKRRDPRPPRRNTLQDFGLNSLSNAAQSAGSLCQQPKTSEGAPPSDITGEGYCSLSSIKKSARRESSCASFSRDKIKMDQSIEVAILDPQLRAERVHSGFRINASATAKSRKRCDSSHCLEAACLAGPPNTAFEHAVPPRTGAYTVTAARLQGRQRPAAAPGLESLTLLEKTSTERSIISTRPYRRFNFLQNDIRLPEDSPARCVARDLVCSPQRLEDPDEGLRANREDPFTRASAFKRVHTQALGLPEPPLRIQWSNADSVHCRPLDLFSQSSRLLGSADKDIRSKVTPTSAVDPLFNKPALASLSAVCRGQPDLPAAKETRADRSSLRSGACPLPHTPDESLLPKRQESRGSRHFSDTRITRASSALNEQPQRERFAELFKTRRHEIRRGNSRQKQGSTSSLSRFSCKTPDIPRFQSPTLRQPPGGFGLFQAKSLEQSYTVHVTTHSARPATDSRL